MTSHRIIQGLNIGLLIVLLASFGWGENICFPAGALAVDVTASPYSATGDGHTDDTKALQSAIDATRGSLRTLYFPNGTYLISSGVGLFNSLPHSRDRFVTWQGQSELKTVIRLMDRAEGFQDSANPRIVLSIYDGKSTGDAMHNYIRNMTVDVGTGNPGAIGVRFMSNNVGAMDRVTITSSDPERAGAIGLDLRQSQNGPALIKRVSIRGFDKGIVAGPSVFSLVFEHILLDGQRIVGMSNDKSRTTIRGLVSRNRCTALHIAKESSLTLIEADLKEGMPDCPAITAEDSRVFLRDIRQSGYQGTVRDQRGILQTGNVLREWHGTRTFAFNDGSSEVASLRLPIVETPDVPWEEDMSKWFTVEAKEGDITLQLQTAIDAAVAHGKTTLYFPPYDKKLVGSGPIRLHGSINRVIGMSCLLSVADPHNRFGDNALFTIGNTTAKFVVIERFFNLGGQKSPPVTMLANDSDAVIVLKDCGISGIMKKASPGKKWFIENVSPSRISTLFLGRNEEVWARQFNPESPRATMMENDGGTLWILGLKTEGRSTHLLARAQSRNEIIGGVSYQSWGKQALDPPMFKIVDSQFSATLGFYHYKSPFSTIVEETSGGIMRTVKREDLKPYHLCLYRSSTASSP